MEPKVIMWIVIAAVVLLVIAAIGYAIYKKEEVIEWLHKPEVIQMIKELIVKAEDVILGPGSEKMQWVCEQIIIYAMKYVPGIGKYLTAASMLRLMKEIIQILFDELAHLLPDGTKRAMFIEDYVAMRMMEASAEE